jgi:hypothetical protein
MRNERVCCVYCSAFRNSLHDRRSGVYARIPMDVSARLEQHGKSDRELGRLIHERVTRALPRGRKVLPATSISPKLGELRRGITTWWRKPARTHYLAALADLLGCDREDLVGAPTAQERSPFIDLPEIPASAAHSPAPLYGGTTLGDLATRFLDAREAVWLIVPDGCGKSLVVREAKRTRPDVVAKTVQSLAQAEAHFAGERPLLLEVERPSPDTDDRARAVLPAGRTAICVLAPFDPPPSFANCFQVLVPALGIDWRARLLAWINAHLDEARRVPAEDWTDWLEAVDPHGVVVGTPGDLLALLACASRHGVPTNKTRLDELARKIIAGRCAALSGTLPWLGHFGAKGFEAMVRARFEATAQRRALSLEAWARILPAEWSPSPEPVRMAELFERLATERSTSARDRTREAIADLQARATPTAAIEQLRSAGLLATTPDGGLEPSPTWVRDAFELACVEQMLNEGDPTRWGPPCADVSRRVVVDTALDRATPKTLVRLAREVLNREPIALGQVAATEAIFAAVGRRVAQGWEPLPTQVEPLQALGLRQWQLLSTLPAIPTHQRHIPLTRRLDREAPEHCARWHAEAWAFTVSVPVPAGDDDYDWRFAGWKRPLRFADLPVYLPTLALPMSHRGSDSNYSAPTPRGPRGFPLTPSERRAYLPFVEIARELLARVVDTELPDPVPITLLVPSLLIARERGWDLRPSHVRLLFGTRALDVLFALLPESHDDWSTLGPWLWEAVTRSGVFGSPATLDDLWQFDRRLFVVVARHLPLDQLIGACPNLPAADLLEELRRVRSPEDVGRLLRSHLEGAVNEPGHLEEHALRALLEALDERDLDVLVRCASDRFGLGILAAARVWAVDADQALRETVAASEADDGSRLYAWLMGAPEGHWAPLLDVIAAHPTRASLRWLADHLPVGGPLAARMFAVWRAQASMAVAWR